MDMAELADLTEMPVRKLRYVFDHRVLPGLATEAPGQGIPRTFTAFEGFGIALAARLLDAGLTRRLVGDCLAVACRRPRAGKFHAPLYHAYTASSGRLEIGDGRYLKLWVAGRRGIAEALDTGWLALGKGNTAPDGYVPMVLVGVELDALAQTVRDA
jgi:hypothetical protein